MPENKVVRLNNTHTKTQVNPMPRLKRQYLGLILIAVILVMILPSINLVKSYQTLQSRQELKAEYEKKSEVLAQQLAIQKENIAKFKDPIFVEKYVRARYSYSKDGEKVFSIPELLDGGITKIK
jgi:cell division protein DivIC